MEYKKSSESFFRHFVFFDIFYSRISYEMTVNFNCGNNFFVLPVVVAKALSSFDAQTKRRPEEGWVGDSWRKGRGKKKHTTPL